MGLVSDTNKCMYVCISIYYYRPHNTNKQTRHWQYAMNDFRIDKPITNRVLSENVHIARFTHSDWNYSVHRQTYRYVVISGSRPYN